MENDMKVQRFDSLPLDGFICGSCKKPLPDVRPRAHAVGKFERSENLTTGYGLVG